MENHKLPETMKALVCHSRDRDLSLDTVPTPQATHGSAVIRVLAANVISYQREIYNGTRPYPFPTPLIGGASAVGRIAAVGPDATKLKIGDLVHVDITIRSRDDPADVFLSAVYDGDTPGSKKLMADVFRDGAFAEYMRVPLENLILLDEARLCSDTAKGGLGYGLGNLLYLDALLVPYGGYKIIGLEPGQTVVVGPATGPFGGGAVLVALAMGAKVIAMGRSKENLERMKARCPHQDRLSTVEITGNVETEIAAIKAANNGAEVDAFLDIGPPAAYKSTHIKSAISSIRHNGKASFMSGYLEDVAIPYRKIMHKNITLIGKWMFERSDAADILKLVDIGLLPLDEKGGVNVIGKYQLEDWKECFAKAATKKFGDVVYLTP
ncbi:Alcohol dehydrogenase GroES-like domain-containing protein 11 [Elsinoe fawcettii]|nr:Alcohol dehydrogenase GroES-like domain-containing protein 11 [Elsinoe fawcettii]